MLKVKCNVCGDEFYPVDIIYHEERRRDLEYCVYCHRKGWQVTAEEDGVIITTSTAGTLIRPRLKYELKKGA